MPPSATPPAGIPPYSAGPAVGGPYAPPPFTPGGGSPYSVTAVVPPAPRAPRRRLVVIGGFLALALAGWVFWMVQGLPDGKSSGTAAKGGGAASSSSGSATAPSAPASGAKADSPRQSGNKAAPKGSLLTTANVRTAIEAFKQKTGTTTFVKMTVYEEYVLADIPTAPGAKTYDHWRYDDGGATRTGPGGTVKADEPLIDMAGVSWDALPGLLDTAKKELAVDNPTMRYVIVEPWLFDQTPSMRPYLMNEYSQGGYIHADTEGKVKKVYRL